MPNYDVDDSRDESPAESISPSFSELGVPGPLARVLAADGKTTAFPIQADTLPDSLSGRDVLGRGRTGSGKTLAFSIPLVVRLGEVDADEFDSMSQFRKEIRQIRQTHREERMERGFLPHPRGLVLAPTRELANQINDVLMPLAQMYGIDTTTVYGGVRYNRQIGDLKAGADIVVACPGRLEDLLNQGALTLEQVRVVVIDEADEMADMGFLPPVKRLLAQISPDAQHMLFSATLDHGVDEVVDEFLHDPKIHSVDSATSQVDEMTHHVFETTRDDKHALVRTLASGSGRRILFTRTKFQAKKLAKNLVQSGIPAAELHGNLNQNQRDRNLAAFESGDVNVMVATDVAARGIDVSDVELVVQVEPPEDPKSFLHRSGRTARAGRSGDVVTLVLPEQRRKTRRMMHEAGLKVTPVEVRSDSPEVLELVGERAEPVYGWTLDQSQPAGNPRRRGNAEGRNDRRPGGRGRGRGDRTGGRLDRDGGTRSARRSQNRSRRIEAEERRYTESMLMSVRGGSAYVDPDSFPADDSPAREGNPRRREKYERRHRMQREESANTSARETKSRDGVEERSGRGGLSKKQRKEQRQAEARSQSRRGRLDRGGRDVKGSRSGGSRSGSANGRDSRRRESASGASSKRIHRNENRIVHDERSADAKRHERRMAARNGNGSGMRRHHSNAKRAPFRVADRKRR